MTSCSTAGATPSPGPAPDLDPIARELLAVITDHHVLEAVDGRWGFSLRKGPTPGSGEGVPDAV